MTNSMRCFRGTPNPSAIWKSEPADHGHHLRHHGRAVLVDKSGTAITETCTQSTYDDNTTAWIRDAVSEKIVAQEPCPASRSSTTPRGT
jgi:hypothetical protein